MRKELFCFATFGSQDIDAPALSKARFCPVRKYITVCVQSDSHAARGDGGRVITVIACQQERPRFEELAAEIEAQVRRVSSIS